MKTAIVYILYSKTLNKFYIGSTAFPVEVRLKQHNNKHYDNSYTFSGIPWIIFDVIQCSSISQARKIEGHFKKMKSKKYIYNLKKYPEMKTKIINRFK